MSNLELKKSRNNLYLKVQLYVMSLWFLFFLIFMLTVYIPNPFSTDVDSIGFKLLFQKNVLAMLALVMIIIGGIFTINIQYKLKGGTNPPYTINKIQNENYEYLTFLTTYIIPLICIDLTSIRYVIILIILLIVIGSIFVRMDLYYGNPTLAFLGYRLYKIEIRQVDHQDGVVVISKDILRVGSAIEWMEISGNIWFAKECK